MSTLIEQAEEKNKKSFEAWKVERIASLLRRQAQAEHDYKMTVSRTEEKIKQVENLPFLPDEGTSILENIFRN